MLYKFSALLILLLVLIGFLAWENYQSALTTSVVSGQPVTLMIEKGDSFNRVTNKLLTHGLEINPYWFKFYAYQYKLTQKIKVGEFVLQSGMTMPEVIHALVAGKVKQYAITFPEGWTFKQIKARIQQFQYIKQTISDLSDQQIMQQLDSKYTSPEGLFFPDTYQFEKNMTDLSLLKRAYARMQTVLELAWRNRASDCILNSPYEALILASIVEKETGIAGERAKIAGVFTRRLRKGMLLQSDPTIIYGMGDAYNGNIRSRDIKAATPYNTYVIRGLPPTPIAMPGRQAIEAVLHPADGKSLYFVANGNGGHIFSNTLKDHNRAVNRYQKGK